jgi:diguanylate cyclase (GGDEF)-like protein
MADMRFKILIADDDEDDVFLVKEALRESLSDSIDKIEWASSYEKAMSMIEKGDHDICILDYNLGEINGIELLKMIRQKGFNMPIVFLTGRGDHETAVEAMKAGATDYLIKIHLTPEMLAQSIRYGINLREQKQQREKAENALQAQERLLQSSSKATSRLLTHQDHSEGMQDALSILAKAIDSQWACVFQHHHGNELDPVITAKFFWVQEKHNSEKEDVVLPEISYSELELNGVIDKLNLGETVYIRDKGLERIKIKFSQNVAFQSLILIPILIESKYWGFIAFGDLDQDRELTRNEHSIIKTVAASMGGEIKRHTEEKAFRSIVEGTSSRVGDDFFHSLVSHLASALPARNAYVSELVDSENSQCCILAGWEAGNYLKKETFNIEGTPFEEVTAGMKTYIPDGVQKYFRGHKLFLDFKPKSFAGVPCFDSSCKVIGHLSVLDDQPMEDEERTMSILKIFAARAGAELERKRTEGVIRNMAYHDALTSLPNRVLLSDRLEMALANARRNKTMLALLFLDFDGFKSINDSLGHDVGDQLLKGVARRLQKCLRSQDTVARLGGDEFIILLPRVNNPTDAGVLAQKLLDVVRVPFNFNEHEVKITLSIGIGLFPKDGSNSNDLLKHADEALYLAKNQGKDCYHFFSEEMAEVDN